MVCWTVHLRDEPKTKCASVAVKHKVYHFGRGKNPRDQIEVHIFNTIPLRWMKLPPVTPRRGEGPLDVPSGLTNYTAVLIADLIYIWGAVRFIRDRGLLLYAFDVDTHRWFKPHVSGTVPQLRSYHSACALGKVMFIVGGSHNGTANDIYKLDTTTMVWSLINTSPALFIHRHFSSTIIGTKMFVFGDFGHHGVIRVFDTETNSWLSMPSVQPPPNAYGHSAFAYNGELYIYITKNPDDLWKFNEETFWKKVEPKGNGPSLRWKWPFSKGPFPSEMRCCMVGDRIVLFGGFKEYYTPTDDLYILDLSPTLKTLCKLAVIQYGVEQNELPHDIRWELAAMTRN